MVDINFVVQSVKFYKFGKNSFWLSLVHNKQWNRFLLDITRKFNYIKDGETKEGSSRTYLNLTAAKALIDQLQLAYQLSKKLQDNQCVNIYNIYCLISKMLYIPTHISRKWLRKTRQMECSGTFRRGRHRSLVDR